MGQSQCPQLAGSCRSALERTTRKADLPVIPVVRSRASAEWRGERAILCTAGRTPLDEAAATMFAQLVSAHGLPARVEAAEALSTANILRLDGLGVVLVAYRISTLAARRTSAIRCAACAASRRCHHHAPAAGVPTRKPPSFRGARGCQSRPCRRQPSRGHAPLRRASDRGSGRALRRKNGRLNLRARDGLE